MAFEKVKQSQIIKISLLVSLLVILPRSVSLISIEGLTSDYFSNVTFRDLVLRFLTFFAFSWLIIQFNGNWKFSILKLQPIINHAIVLLGNLAVLFGTAALFRLVLPHFTGSEITSEASRFLEFILGVILIILFFVSRILRFQIFQKASILENEQLKQQNLQNELTALKNQINPHFLFNSLNSLNSLVRGNKPATEFVKKLSFMYRYILQSGDRDLVKIEEELKFLESYTFLIKTRYRDRFTIDLQIEKQYLEKKIPPLALQLLVENAVKHNEISETNPLEVKVYSKDSCIIVSNLIRPRTTFVYSTGNGLNNLDKRYELLKNQNITITKENNSFCVSLPLN